MAQRPRGNDDDESDREAELERQTSAVIVDQLVHCGNYELLRVAVALDDLLIQTHFQRPAYRGGKATPHFPSVVHYMITGRFVRHIGGSRGVTAAPVVAPNRSQVGLGVADQRTLAASAAPLTGSLTPVLSPAGHPGLPRRLPTAAHADASTPMAAESAMSRSHTSSFAARPSVHFAQHAAPPPRRAPGPTQHIRFPSGLTALHNGQLAVSCDDNRIVVITADGSFVKALRIDALRVSRGLAAVAEDVLCVADGENHCIFFVRYPGDGRVFKTIGRVGAAGDGPYEFNGPSGIAVLKERGLIAVCDQLNHRVKVLTFPEGVFVRHIGSRGDGENEFRTPWGITRGFEPDTLVVCDQDNHRLKVITVDGAFVRHIGGKNGAGSGVDEFNRPRGVVALLTGDIAVTDVCNHRVKIHRCSGGHVRSIGALHPRRQRSVSVPGASGRGGNAGASPMSAAVRARTIGNARSFTEPTTIHPLGITVLGDGVLAVGDRDNHRITLMHV
jgi:hypothetical protein